MKKREEIKNINDEVKMVPFENLKAVYGKVTNGCDPLSEEEFKCNSVPDRISRNTYGISHYFKPFSILGTTDVVSPTAAKYYDQVAQSISALNKEMLYSEIEYRIIKIITPWIIKINTDLKHALYQKKIPVHYMYNESVSADFEIIQKELIPIFYTIFNIPTLNYIENMMQMYVRFEDENNQNTMELPYTLVIPFVNEAVMSILYRVYDYTIGKIARATICQATFEGDIYPLDEFEKAIEYIFIDMHNNLIDEFTVLAVNLVLSKTSQHIVPELEEDK